MKSKLSKILLTILAIMLFIPTGLIQVFATGVGDSPYLERGDKGFYSVQYLTNSGEWMYITYSRTFFTDNEGVRRIAYCVDSDLKGIGWISGEVEGYNVNLTEALKDERLWRVYRHGYPYVTPEALGVETEDDAYLATKQAGYCIIEGRPLEDIYKYFRPGEEKIEGENLTDIQRRGKKVVDAIYRLVELGYNGTETPKYNDLIKISKVGECGQDEKSGYFSQKYSVKSSTIMNEYTIESLSDFPLGTYIADLNGTSKTTFSTNEQFKVMIPTDQIFNDIEGKISVKGKCQNYPIYYGKAENGKQNYAVLADSFSDATADTTCHVEGNKSKIKLIKTDSDTNKKIEGVEFNFKYENGENIGNYKTDKNGEINIERLRAGNIIVTEVKTKDEYILNTEEQKVTLGYNQSVTIELQNEHKKGNLKVYKIDADNKRVVLGGVRFALYSYEFDKITGYYTTDKNGEIYIEGLRTGDWALIEEETNKWYNLTDPVDIKVEWDKTASTTIENELKKSQIKIIKVDQEEKEVKLKDVTFEVMDEKGNILETITTDENGEAITSRYPVRDYQNLYIRETITNEKYVLDNTKHKIELKENQIVNMVFENKKIKGSIKIIKTAEDDNKITGTKKGEPISDVKFDIYDESKKYIETIITTEDGTAVSSLLEKGKYYIKEKESAEWYLLNENEYSAEIIKDGDIAEINITNKPENPNVDIEKTGIIQTTANQEIKYDFKIRNTGNVLLNNFTWTDNLPTDYIRITKLITGTYNQDLRYSIYYKTNKNDYKLLKENLSTQVNNYIDFSDLDFDSEEYVTDFKVDFGTVDVGFESVINPYIFTRVNSNVKNDDTFTNKTRIEGYNKTYMVWDEDEHTTKVYEKQINIKKLPRTGC